MGTLRFFNRQAVSMVVAIALLLTLVTPGLVPLVSAADVTNRSITLSNPAANGLAVSYEVEFTVGSAGAAGAFVVDFCKNSPVVGSECVAPDGFSTSGVTTPTSDTTVASRTGNTGVTVTKTIANSATVNVVLAGITNPSYVTTAEEDEGFYARIVTYDTAGNAANYVDNNLGTGAKDGGGVAMSIVSSIGVSAAVRETLTFCVAAETITANCANAPASLPTLTLGTDGALDSSRIDTADLFTQITTNASNGAVVNLKSSATNCGGLVRSGSSVCGITPSTDAEAGFEANEAKFGVKTSAAFATSGVTAATGTLIPAGDYNNDEYFFNYVAGNATGVTSPYGDPTLSTNSLPANNQNMQLTFGASINANTPAGSYGANLNMIAVGTY